MVSHYCLLIVGAIVNHVMVLSSMTHTAGAKLQSALN